MFSKYMSHGKLIKMETKMKADFHSRVHFNEKSSKGNLVYIRPDFIRCYLLDPESSKFKNSIKLVRSH